MHQYSTKLSANAKKNNRNFREINHSLVYINLQNSQKEMK